MTRLNGPPFAVNPDLVQRIDSAPDTILTLVDGTKYIVQESMQDVIELVNEHRSRMIARAQEIQRDDLESARESRASLRSAPALPPDDEEPSPGRSTPPPQPELSLVARISEEDV